jgi:hypothetical protein
MQKYRSICLRLLTRFRIYYILLATFLSFSFSFSAAYSQGFNKGNKRYAKASNKAGRIDFKRNILWLEVLGSNQIAGIKYERILMFGSVISVRFDLGLTPFSMDEKYYFSTGKCLTPIMGLGFYFHLQPFPVRIGLGCSVLNDLYFDRIPETVVDTAGGVINPYAKNTYRARVMPYAIVEATIKERWTIRAGYTPIIDPANDAQTELYFTHWATLGFGYKFGR